MFMTFDRGIGRWFLTEMREFFNSIPGASQDDGLAKGGIGESFLVCFRS